jgi:hypothetical protein
LIVNARLFVYSALAATAGGFISAFVTLSLCGFAAAICAFYLRSMRVTSTRKLRAAARSARLRSLADARAAAAVAAAAEEAVRVDDLLGRDAAAADDDDNGDNSEDDEFPSRIEFGPTLRLTVPLSNKEAETVGDDSQSDDDDDDDKATV